MLRIETSERFQERGSSVDVGKYNLEGVDLKTRFPNVNEAKLLRKIDMRVVPVLCIMYLLAFLDRCVSIQLVQVHKLTRTQSEHLECGDIRAQDRPEAGRDGVQSGVGCFVSHPLAS